MTSSSAAQRGRVPDFFIVGQPKTGTTALFRMIGSHPQIFMPRIKEPHFLATDQNRQQTRQSEPVPDTFEEYLALFEMARPDQRVGEASTSYLQSGVAASNIKALQPSARVIAILREPASLLRSLHLHLLKMEWETEESLREAMRLEADRRLGLRIPRAAELPQQLLYSDQVRYVEQLRRYHSVFGQDQVLVLIYDDFRQRNAVTVREVLRFLDVDDSFPVDLAEANPTVRVRSRHFYDLVNAVSAARGPVLQSVKAGTKALTPQAFRRRVLTRLMYGTPPPADERLMQELRRRFEPEVVALSEYLGRDLVTLWGYDSVG